MKLLLDTHVLIWFALGSDKLSQTAEELIYDRQNDLWLSIAGIWEMQIKI
jgi:PIN domain nuclease of toxin-antitoxin system